MGAVTPFSHLVAIQHKLFHGVRFQLEAVSNYGEQVLVPRVDSRSLPVAVRLRARLFQLQRLGSVGLHFGLQRVRGQLEFAILTHLTISGENSSRSHQNHMSF